MFTLIPPYSSSSSSSWRIRQDGLARLYKGDSSDARSGRMYVYLETSAKQAGGASAEGYAWVSARYTAKSTGIHQISVCFSGQATVGAYSTLPASTVGSGRSVVFAELVANVLSTYTGTTIGTTNYVMINKETAFDLKQSDTVSINQCLQTFVSMNSGTTYSLQAYVHAKVATVAIGVAITGALARLNVNVPQIVVGTP